MIIVMMMIDFAVITCYNAVFCSSFFIFNGEMLVWFMVAECIAGRSYLTVSLSLSLSLSLLSCLRVYKISIRCHCLNL